jgi:hypothetical protein
MSEDPATIIRSEGDLINLVWKLEPFCDAGSVADISTTNGLTITGVLIGVSSTALILDHWDNQAHRPAGDPFTIALELVSEVVMP